MKRSYLRVGICWMLLFALSTTAASAAGVVLYDGALGGTPDSQLMIYQGIGGVQSSTNGVTTLNTTLSSAVQAGYQPKPGVLPSLDRAQGFTLQFTTQLISESHSNSDRNNDAIDDRAGFSVIALASDQRGIELGFWSDRIWAQAGGGAGDGALFTQAEGAPIDTTVTRTYELAIQGTTYRLSSGNTVILSGPLRNYSSFGVPYSLGNFIFLGDNTTSASAIVRISSILATPMPQQYRVALPLVTR